MPSPPPPSTKIYIIVLPPVAEFRHLLRDLPRQNTGTIATATSCGQIPEPSAPPPTAENQPLRHRLPRPNSGTIVIASHDHSPAPSSPPTKAKLRSHRSASHGRTLAPSPSRRPRPTKSSHLACLIAPILKLQIGSALVKLPPPVTSDSMAASHSSLRQIRRTNHRTSATSYGHNNSSNQATTPDLPSSLVGAQPNIVTASLKPSPPRRP